MDELVTAVITTHKREATILKRAIESVLHQTYKNFEIIVVDDAPDYEHHNEIESMISSYCGKVKYIINNRKCGACVSRNIGIRNARGIYIALLDDDDEWCTDKLEVMMPKFQDEHIGMVYANYRTVSLKKQVHINHTQNHYSGNIFNELILYGNFIGGCSVPVFKKECVEKIGYFDENLESSQDYDFWLRVARSYNISYIDFDAVIYYISGDAISASPKRKIESSEKILNKYFKEFEERPEAKKRMETGLIYYLIANGMIADAKKTYVDNKAIVGRFEYTHIFIKGLVKFLMLKLNLQNR